jgi:hypothetical protein
MQYTVMSLIPVQLKEYFFVQIYTVHAAFGRKLIYE